MPAPPRRMSDRNKLSQFVRALRLHEITGRQNTRGGLTRIQKQVAAQLLMTHCVHEEQFAFAPQTIVLH